MITIHNTQRRVFVDVDTLQTEVQRMLDLLEYADFDLGILLASEQKMRSYNKQYRGKDVPTDILSFAYHPQLKAGERIVPETDDDKNLGDLILAPTYIQKHAHEWHQTFDERIHVLIVHGICHLLGYDHESDADFELMEKKEQWIVKQWKNSA
ncbi:MAG TPA: rRNA maturation RNase YbeY [Candidatus Bathyarchaeia archaeon]|nr:rRNA maturation RNase YbeY [Candidatus Bathyarchaeia archaeon]